MTAITASQEAVKRRIDVLKGGFATGSGDKDSGSGVSLWKAPTWKLLLFVSSTFTDTTIERDILIDKIRPRLVKRAQDIGVTLVDMRWGVRDENSLDHRTWIECKRELIRCKEESTSLYFLSLQSEKYGYVSLPKFVDQPQMEAKLSSCTDDALQALAKRWYLLDANHIPARYTLQNLRTMDDKEFWGKVLPGLRELLAEIPFEQDDCDDLVIGRSVTEWEVKRSLADDASLSRCMWFHRTFKGEFTQENDPHRLFFDAITPSLAKKYEHLKAWMTSRIPSERIVLFRDMLTVEMYQQYTINHGNHDAAVAAYSTKWEQEMQSRLFQELAFIQQLKQRWEADSFGLGLPGKVLEEILQHCNWADNKCRDFVGRTQLVDQMLQLAAGEKGPTNKFGISFSVVGVSGVGKTALMAKTASLLYQQEQAKGSSALPVIIRFCGSTSGSTNGLSLIQSICEQLLFLFPTASRNRQALAASADYQQAVSYFHSLMGSHAVVLLIDSLDQLSDAYLARSRISFLDGLVPHPASTIIVSCLPDEKHAITQEWVYYYGCDIYLSTNQVPRVVVSKLTVDSSSAGTSAEGMRAMMQTMLAAKSRQLTEAQWRVVLQKASAEPTVLYMKLALRTVERWTSFQTSLALPDTVQGLIMQMFNDIERSYGALLTSTILAMITFSDSGLSDNEIEDIISLDDNVLNAVFQYHTPTVRRLPSHVWLRIRSELAGLITEREGGCLKWYHRQLQETAEKKYAGLKTHCLALIGTYFCNLVELKLAEQRQIGRSFTVILPDTADDDAQYKDGAEASYNKMVWSTGFKVNARRCVEGSIALIAAGLLNEAANELCHIEMIGAYVRLGRGVEVVKRLAMLQGAVTTATGKRTAAISDAVNLRVSHYLRWLRQRISIISLTGYMSLVYDCTESQPMHSIAFQDVVDYVSKTRANAMPFAAGTVTRSIALKGKTEFNGVISTLTGHASRVSCLYWHDNGKLLVSGFKNGMVKVWDTVSGELLNEFRCNSSIVAVYWTADGKQIAACSATIFYIWDAATGLLRNSINVSSTYPAAKVGIKQFILNAVAGRVAIKFVVEREIDERAHYLSGTTFEYLLCDSTTGERVSGRSTRKNDFCISSDGLKLAIPIIEEGTVGHKVLDMSKGDEEEVLAFLQSERPFSSAHDGGDKLYRWCKGGAKADKRLLLQSDVIVLRIWDLTSNTIIGKIHGKHVKSNGFRNYAWSSDGSKIVTMNDYSFQVWSAANGELISASAEDPIMLQDVKPLCSPGSDRICLVSNVNSSPVMLVFAISDLSSYDVFPFEVDRHPLHREEDLYSFMNRSSGVKTIMAWCPDNQHIAYATSGDIHILNSIRAQDATAKKGKAIQQVAVTKDSYLLFSQDQRNVAVCTTASVQVMDSATGKLLSGNTFEPKHIVRVLWRPDGAKIAAALDDASVRLWNPLSGAEVKILKGLSGNAKSMSWSPDGLFMQVGVDNGDVFVFNIDKGKAKRITLGVKNAKPLHAAEVNGVTWSSFEQDSGQLLFSGSKDGQLLALRCETDKKKVEIGDEKVIKKMKLSGGIAALQCLPEPKVLGVLLEDHKLLVLSCAALPEMAKVFEQAAAAAFVWNASTRSLICQYTPDAAALSFITVFDAANGYTALYSVHRNAIPNLRSIESRLVIGPVLVCMAAIDESNTVVIIDSVEG